MANKGKLTLMEELKLRQKERKSNSYKSEAKNEEESTPIKQPKPSNGTTHKKIANNDARKAILSQFLAHKPPNPKPSRAHQTSLSDIPGSTDQIGVSSNHQNQTISTHHDNDNESSSSFFSKDSNDNNQRINNPLSTIKSGDEEEKYDVSPMYHNNDDTMSIYTDSTYISTTASVQSMNGRKKKKKKRKKKQPRIIQQGSHITCSRPRKYSVSRSSDIPALSHSQHTPPNSPPLSLQNLEQHNQIMLRKRNVNSGLSIINGIGDGIPALNQMANKEMHRDGNHEMFKREKVMNDTTEQIEMEIVPNKTRDSFAKLDLPYNTGFDHEDDDHEKQIMGAPKLSIYDLTLKAQLWSMNIFGFLCSIDLMINIPTLYKACIDIDANSDENNLFIWILVIYVIFQVISAFVISIFVNYGRIKWILILLSICLFFGNILYTYGVSDGDSVFLLFVGRALCGIAGSILIFGYSQVTLCSNILNRENLVVIFRFITSIGMIVGPLIGLLMTVCPEFYVFNKMWLITDTNGGSFIMSILALIYLIIFIIYLLYNYFIKSKQKQKELDKCNDISQMHEKQEINYKDTSNIKSSTDEIVKRQKYSDKYNKAILYSKTRQNHSLFFNKYVILLLFLYISSLFTFWSFSAVIIPIGGYHENSSEYKYNQTVIYGIFAFIGCIYIISFFINRLLNYKIFKSTSFDKRVIISIQIQCIGYFLLTTFGIYDSQTSPYSIPLAQLICATFFICIGFGIATLQIPAIFCLVTGAKLKNIGIRMSWFFIISSIGRIIGPIFGYYMIKAQDGSIDLLAHISSFYLLIISLIALIIIMEANKLTAFFPQPYYDKINNKYLQNVSYSYNINLHSDRHSKLQRVPSKSITQSITPYSKAKFTPNLADGSVTSKSMEHKKYEQEMKDENKLDHDDHDEDDDKLMDIGQRKKHFNYSPVQRTESTESIKVNYKPKKTFLEKFNHETDTTDDELNYYNHMHNEQKLGDSKKNLLQKIKSKSSRLLNKNGKKEKKKSPTNIQSVDVGLNDLQL